MAGEFEEPLENEDEAIQTASSRELVPTGDSFPDNWSSEDRADAYDLKDQFEEYYTGYFIPGFHVKDTSDSSKFSGREDNALQIKINPAHKKKSLAHELGHDVERQLIDVEGSVLEVSTLKELFADLNALHFTYIEPDNRHLNRDPRKDIAAYKGLGAALSPEIRGEELEHLDQVLDAANEQDWEEASRHARNLVDIPPHPGKIEDFELFRPELQQRVYENRLVDDEYHHRNNMFFENILDDYIKNTTALRTDIWRIADTLANQQLGPVETPVRKALDERNKDSRIGVRLYWTADQKFSGQPLQNPEQVLGKALVDEVESAKLLTESYREALEEIDEPLADFVQAEIGSVRYGNDDHGNYDESIDFPHNVGGQLAEELYEEGIEPRDVLENPGKYRQKASNRIRQELQHHI